MARGSQTDTADKCGSVIKNHVLIEFIERVFENSVVIRRMLPEFPGVNVVTKPINQVSVIRGRQ